MAFRQLYKQPSTKLTPNIWDVVALLLVFSIIIAITWAGSNMTLPFHLGEHIPITLNPTYLPKYALETVIRMFIALFCSLIFSFVVATTAAKSKRAGKVIIPIIDILQSVPIMGYLSISVLGFIALFPNSMMGPECAAIFAVFTSQVWNMTLSFYQSMRTVPKNLCEAAHMCHLSAWQRFWRVEVPYATPGLVWNAIVSMSGGWFFIVASEAISVANQHITLPGIGSYIALAIVNKNMHAITYAIAAMLGVILLYDQFFFRPILAWSEKFKVSGMTTELSTSWFLNLLNRTRFVQKIGDYIGEACENIINFSLFRKKKFVTKKPPLEELEPSFASKIIWYSILFILLAITAVLVWSFIYKVLPVSATWHVFVLGSFTALRVFVLILICSLIWIPIGIWIGLRPQFAQYIQPVAQFLAAFPANLLFPIFFIVIWRYHLNVEIWTAPLMVLGTQWYILFNVIAGASSIPKDLRLAAKNMQLSGFTRWRKYLFPSVFPFYVTGAISAAGGSWNASVVAEVINWGHHKLIATGLGSYIAENTSTGHFHRVALGVVVMCFWVTLVNLLFWRRLYNFAESRFRV